MGTGLGLSVVSSIIREYGGKITCESEPGQGTTFKMFLPLPASNDGVEFDLLRKPIGSDEIVQLTDSMLVRTQ